MKAIRTQVDDLGDQVSLETGLYFHPDEEGARQEFREECDIQSILRRYGHPGGAPLTFGEVDYEVNLQTALDATRSADEAFTRLPDAIRKRYRDWKELAVAAERGELVEAKPEPEPAPPEKAAV